MEAIDLLPNVEPARPPCFMTLAARKKLGEDGDWFWCKAECVGDDFLLEGGKPPRFSKGKRAGQHNWKGVKLTRLIVTAQERDQAEADYEVRTGLCRSCAGSGQEVQSWHYQNGYTYRTCRRCSGSGSPVEVTP